MRVKMVRHNGQIQCIANTKTRAGTNVIRNKNSNTNSNTNTNYNTNRNTYTIDNDNDLAQFPLLHILINSKTKWPKQLLQNPDDDDAVN